MGYSSNRAIYVRTFTQKEMETVVKITEGYGVVLNTGFDDKKCSGVNIWIDTDALHEMVMDISDEVPNCLIIYSDSGWESVTGTHDYAIFIKYPKESDLVCLCAEDESVNDIPAHIRMGFSTSKDIFDYIYKTGVQVNESQAFDIMEIFGEEDVFDSNSEKWGTENLILKELPKIVRVSESNTTRVARIEDIKVDDALILKAHFRKRSDPPVRVEVLNGKKQTLGYFECEEDLGIVLNKIEAYVDNVTPLSTRKKNAKYALVDVKLILKK